MKKKMRKLMEGLASSIEAQYPLLSENEQKNLLEDFIYNSLINTYLSEGPKLDALIKKINTQREILKAGKPENVKLSIDQMTTPGADPLGKYYGASAYMGRVNQLGTPTMLKLARRLEDKKRKAMGDGRFFSDPEKIPLPMKYGPNRAISQDEINSEFRRKAGRVAKHLKTLQDIKTAKDLDSRIQDIRTGYKK